VAVVRIINQSTARWIKRLPKLGDATVASGAGGSGE